MNIVHRNDLHRGGFAGLKETRMVMDPKAWGSHVEPGARQGLGNFVYLADARFLPHGETKMHPHREIDVISIIMEGRIAHQGSLEHGQELNVFDVQVQRAGGEGFYHNELNPDEVENRMLQLWVLPEVPGEPAGYQVFRPESGQRLRIYGGSSDQQETFPAKTVMEVARLNAGDELRQDSEFIAYVATGSGLANGEEVSEGDLLNGDSVSFLAQEESFLVLVHQGDMF
ncbi:MAG: redox-sensitive bicupin YhaK (pirin superfamily) [Lysobacterales bacterium]|jgi:redox-sensitive bicupin YhaK (pirin superfamily)